MSEQMMGGGKTKMVDEQNYRRKKRENCRRKRGGIGKKRGEIGRKRNYGMENRKQGTENLFLGKMLRKEIKLKLLKGEDRTSRSLQLEMEIRSFPNFEVSCLMWR